MAESRQEPREAWSEVGRRFDDLGRALRGHFGEPDAPGAGTERPSDAPGAGEPAGAGTGGAAAGGAAAGGAGAGGAGAGGGSDAGDRAAVQDALRRLSEAAQRLGDQAAEAVRDPAVRESAQQVARSFGDALAATFSEFGDELRSRTHSSRWSGAAEPQPPATQPPAAQIEGAEESSPNGGGTRPAGG